LIRSADGMLRSSTVTIDSGIAAEIGYACALACPWSWACGWIAQ
jgi:nucleoside 2-deoxyribosyltransferase